MQKLLIKAVSEPQSYGQAKWFDVTDGEGKEYLCSKMEQRTQFAVGQLNDVRTWAVEGKKKLRIELVTGGAVIPEKGKIIPKTEHLEVNPNLRSMVCAYAKDLACYGKIEVNDIEGWADYFLGYIVGGGGETVERLDKQIDSLLKKVDHRQEVSQSKSGVEPRDSKSLADEAVELGGEVVPSAEEVKVKVAKLIEANKTLKVGTFVAMMEKLQVGATAKSEKNKFGNATLVGVYQVLNDDNKIKFNKQIG